MVISVALCTYNGESFLEKQLHSILNQSAPVDEIVICDDNSADSTHAICRKYELAYPGKIRFQINENNLGPKKNFEKAIGLASGDIIFLSDQDDTWPQDKVRKITEAFNNNPGVKGIFTNGILADEDSNSKGPDLWEAFMYTPYMQTCLKIDNLFEMILRNGAIVTGATLAIVKEAKKDILPFKYTHDLWHDEWIGYRLAALNALMPYNQPLFNYRIHTNQQVGIYIADFDRRIAQRERFFKKQFLPGEEKFYIYYIFSRLKHARKIITYFPEMQAILQKLENEFKSEKARSFKKFGLFYRKALLLKWIIEKRYETSMEDFFFT